MAGLFSPEGHKAAQAEWTQIEASKRSAVRGVGDALDKEASAGRMDATIATQRGADLRKALQGAQIVQIVEQAEMVSIGNTVEAIFYDAEGDSLRAIYTIGAWGESLSRDGDRMATYTSPVGMALIGLEKGADAALNPPVRINGTAYVDVEVTAIHPPNYKYRELIEKLFPDQVQTGQREALQG